MEKIIKLFHYVSFIKYPIMLLGLYFAYKPIIFDDVDFIPEMNTGLLLVGLGLGLDSLKDYGKLNWLDKKVLHRPKIAIFYFGLLGLSISAIILIGMIGYFSANDNALKDLSIGLIVFGIGAIGFLKTGIEATKTYMETKR